MSSRGTDVDKINQYEQEFIDFLLKKIVNVGGSIPLQHLTGHLSQLNFDIRCTIGTSLDDITRFLKSHQDLFSVKNNVVRLIDSSSSKDGGYDSDCSSSMDQFSSLPSSIQKGKGVIIKIFPEFGFIRMKEPIKTEAYFKASSLGENNVDLTSSLFVGCMVYFNAKKKKSNEKQAKYYATKVWKVDVNDALSNAVVKRSRKNHETGLYDPIVLESDGYIQRVFPNLGFITVKGDESNTVFFHKNRLLKYDNIVDLTKVLSEGDSVEFTAHRSTKPDAKARWEAFKVWKKSSKNKEGNFSKSESYQGENCVKLDSSSKNRNKEKEMIRNQRGKICPRAQGTVIKFGQSDIADGDGSTYYIDGRLITEVSWEFCDGDDVLFDAVKIKSPPVWKAVLVWTGKRPDNIHPTYQGGFTEDTDEDTDDISSVLSYSSNSSLKSASTKSGNSSSKVKNHQGSSLKLTQSKDEEKEIRKTNLRSYKTSSHHGSQNSLSSSISSKNSEKFKKGQKIGNFNQKKSSSEKKLSSCWGDSPYFPDGNDQSISTPDRFSCASERVSKHENIKNKFEEIPQNKSFDDEEMSKVKNSKLSDSPINIKDENKSKSVNNNKACIRNFQCLEGSITKVCSKFATVKSSKLPNIISFFWNNFYYRGVSVEELELEDLNQVLRVGESVHFNYFEVVDDSGQEWKKVTMAWSGSKPEQFNEMTPHDFIKQNNLFVSIIDEVNIDDELEKVVSRKFLSAYEDEDPKSLSEEASNEEYCSEKELPSTVDNFEESEPFSQSPEPFSVSPVDHSIVLNEIIEILRKDPTLLKLKVNLKSISEEILNIVLENHKQKKCVSELNSEFLPDEKCVSTVSPTSCSNCGNKSMLDSSSQIKTKNSEVQTIITGEIIAQNIYTEC